MTDLAEFPDVEDAIQTAIVDLVPDDDTNHTGTVTPPDLATVTPFVRVVVFGGADDTVTDTSHVDVDVFAGTIAEAKTLSGLIRQRLTCKPHVVVSDGSTVVLDQVITAQKPHETPWADNMQIRRVTAAYTITARRCL